MGWSSGIRVAIDRRVCGVVFILFSFLIGVVVFGYGFGVFVSWMCFARFRASHHPSQ